jgi:hypothetical protein
LPPSDETKQLESLPGPTNSGNPFAPATGTTPEVVLLTEIVECEAPLYTPVATDGKVVIGLRFTTSSGAFKIS